MLTTKHRVRGARARKVLEENGFADVAGLAERVRAARVPEWPEGDGALRKRAAETSREVEARRAELVELRDNTLDASVSTDTKVAAAARSLQVAEKAHSKLSGELQIARHAWQPKRSKLTKQILYNETAVITRAMNYLAGAIEGSAELEALERMAEEIEVDHLSPPPPGEPDGRVTLALLICLGQGVDQLFDQFEATGLKWARIRRELPSRALNQIVGGLG